MRACLVLGYIRSSSNKMRRPAPEPSGLHRAQRANETMPSNQALPHFAAHHSNQHDGDALCIFRRGLAVRPWMRDAALCELASWLAHGVACCLCCATCCWVGPCSFCVASVSVRHVCLAASIGREMGPAAAQRVRDANFMANFVGMFVGGWWLLARRARCRVPSGPNGKFVQN